MANTYQFSVANNAYAIRSGDGAVVPWNATANLGPLDIGGAAGQTWIADGSPTPDAYVAPPAPPLTLSFLQFMALFTPTEQAAIANSTDTQTRLFLLMATGTGTIDMTNAELIAGVNYLASGPSLIAAGRPAQILANQTPS